MPDTPLDPAASAALIADPDGRHAAPAGDHAPPARPGRPAAPGTSSRISPPSRPTRSKKRMRWPMPSRGRPGTSCRASWAICCCRRSIMRRWPTRPGCSALTMWSRAISDKMVARHPHVFGDRKPRQDARAADRGLGEDQGRRTRARPRVLDGVALGLARPDAGGEAAEARGAGRVRLALHRRGAWPRSPKRPHELVEARDDPDRSRDGRGIRRSAVRDGQSCAASEDRPRSGAARAPMPSSPAGSAGSRIGWPRRARRPADSDLAEMDALWNRAKAEEKAAKGR